ncbi:hypothetical protein R5W23_000141 [Gemmata sp. JC673]|uniref:Uncharacterized protein n=1 Tax=Gemmata algarum TaxID=2975278 RepID=A0ABU5ERK3_9BACT|nr:hypothetical protein [Gemmata algarum]MDY3557614.1 hypothetical protein [Gemmata algarum]
MTASGGMCSFEEKDEFFAKLDGPLLRCYGSTNNGEIRGYRVIGYAASNEERVDKDRKSDASEAINSIFRTQRHVAILGVKTFDTEAEARTWANETIEGADP